MLPSLTFISIFIKGTGENSAALVKLLLKEWNPWYC